MGRTAMGVVGDWMAGRLCGLWAGPGLGDPPWKDIRGALLAEVKSSAYGDLDRRPKRRLS